MDDGVARLMESLGSCDVTGASYPSDVRGPDERRRWNQARLVALALHEAYEPTSIQPGEFSQSLYMFAQSIYHQAEFATGTDEELAEEISTALRRGWL